ncbi:hypothetical protein [Serratia marcescens]|uniref:hypothetical protein n=1 Tax=Serratia marcescens TaxID=615 RepID=UPI003204895E
MKNNVEYQYIKIDNSDFTFLTNQKSWLKIPADGSPLTFTGNADDAAKEFFNALIRVRDGYISALKAERDAQQKRADALAVENQALKDVFVPGEAVVNFLSIALRRTKYDYINLPDVALAFKMSLPETPTTDAALAAIEARGVEKAAEALDALSAQSASTTTQANFRAAAVYLRTAVIPAIGEAK